MVKHTENSRAESRPMEGRSAKTGRVVSKSTALRASGAAKLVRAGGKQPKADRSRKVRKPQESVVSHALAYVDGTGLDGLDPSTTEARDATHLRRIVAAARGVEDAEAELRRVVADARADGESWSVIGAALGVSRQGAHQRFGR